MFPNRRRLRGMAPPPSPQPRASSELCSEKARSTLRESAGPPQMMYEMRRCSWQGNWWVGSGQRRLLLRPPGSAQRRNTAAAGCTDSGGGRDHALDRGAKGRKNFPVHCQRQIF
ncbi:unnamed protein product [Urochloa humidicola]